MADIDVYNLDAGSSSKDIYDLSTSDTGTTTDESEGPTPSTDLSETDIIDLVKDILDGFDGRLVIGTESSNQAFISDANGIYLGGSNFSTAVFSVDMNGNLTASSATITGSITATTGTIGGWTVTATTLQSTNITLDSSNEVILLGSATAPLTGDGIFFGKDGAAFEFRAGSISGSKYLHYDGTNLNLVGGAISSSIITALGAGSEIAIQGWQFDGAFSATDNDTVAWATGTITLLDGTTYSITGANTGNITAVTYIYLDIAVSTTLLQTSTTASDAVGSGKILMAVAEDNSDATKDATFQVFGGTGGQGVFITADNVAANTITANEIAVNTITAAEIAATTITGTEISSLSISGKSIVADTGSIGGWTLSATTLANGTDIILDSSSKAISIKDATFGNDGIQLQYNAGTPRIYFGDGSSQFFQFDGTTATVNNSTLAFENSFGDGSDGSATITGGTTTLTQDMNYTTLTVEGSGILDLNGFRVFASVSITIDSGGVIQINGNDGGAGANAISNSGGIGGTAGAAIADGSVEGAVAGQAGGLGGSAGAARVSGVNGSDVAKSLGVVGAGGGGGYDPGGGSTVGASNGGAQTGTVFNFPRSAMSAYFLLDVFPSLDNLKSSSGSGSGGGGDRTGGTSAGGGGGGSATPGGICTVFGRVISNAGSITATGGDGGAGGNGFSSTGGSVGGGGGGGAGGSGGVIIVVYSQISGAGTITAAAGAVGAGGLGEINGAPYAFGDGDPASAANAGTVIEIQV